MADDFILCDRCQGRGFLVLADSTDGGALEPDCPDCGGMGEVLAPYRPPHPEICLAHLERQPCGTCRAYIAAGL